MSLRDHLKELRNRLIIALVAFTLVMAVGFITYEPAFTILTDQVSRLSTEEHPVEVVFSSVGHPHFLVMPLTS